MTAKEIEARQDELYEELDKLEGCEDNEAYADRIHEIRDEIARLNYEEPDPEEFSFEVTITGTVTVSAVTLKEAEALVYDACKNHEFIAVQRVEIEEELA